ncbi:MAG: hypothetical protein IPI32_01100 [Austwickia sp.]|nr:hypothetical protein [Austwickia sp.]MBK8437558.1 hypothetical protein [Austwickia sp.]MBK9102824.1 hypothetical protein [Austwickia sp.]
MSDTGGGSAAAPKDEPVEPPVSPEPASPEPVSVEPVSPVSAEVPLTREALVPAGAAWRACLATIRTGVLRRPVVLVVAFAIFLALPLLGGTPWPWAALQAVIGTVIVLVLSVGLAWLRVRRWYVAGSRWQGGLGATGLRLAFPNNDLTLPASAIRGVHQDRDLLLLTVGPRSLQLALPQELFTVAEVEELIARGAQPPAPGVPTQTSGTPADGSAGLATGPVVVPRRQVPLSEEFAQSIPKTLARLELTRPLSMFLLIFGLYQGFRAISVGDTLSLLIAVMAAVSWVGLAIAPYLQGRRLYQPGLIIGAGLGEGKLAVSLGDKVVEHDATVVRKVLAVPGGVALRLADGGVLVFPEGLLSQEQLAELTQLAATKRSRRGR